MRILAICTALLALTACNRGIENKEAVRQSVLDYLATKAGLNVSSMKIDVTDVKFENNQATANVSFAAKDAKAGPGGMSMAYTLEKSGNKWVVKGKTSSGPGAAHGAGAMPPMPGMPGMPNPHGDAPGGAPREIPGGDMPRTAPPAPKQ